MELEIKKKLQHVERDHKKAEWYFNLWREFDDDRKIGIYLKILFNDIKEL